MIQNIKTDIIYYCVPKDFEMEFNLCGCCRMRLLTAQANDIDELLNCMKMAVARSRVILFSGNLGGDSGLFNVVAKAIGRKTERFSGTMYGINNTDDINILENAIPLITSNGVLAGCVVEQGPQAIIIIDNKKELNREIMRNFIHPYISDLSRLDESVAPIKQAQPVPAVDETVQESSGEPTSPSVIEEIPMQSQTQEDDNPSELNTPANVTPLPEVTPLITQTEAENLAGYDEVKVSEIFNFKNNNELIFDIPFNDDEDDDYGEIYDKKSLKNEFVLNKKSKHKNKQNILLSPAVLILICVLLFALAVIIYFLVFKPLQNGISVSQNFNNLFNFVSVIGGKFLW